MKLPKPLLHFLNWFPHQGFAFVSCAVFIIGLLVGRAVMSIGMIMLLANALINLNVSNTFIQFCKNRTSVLLTGLFILYACSFFWSSNVPYYFTRIQLMLPFLVLPFSFQSIKWDRKYFDYLAMLFVAVCIVGSCTSLYSYLLDKEAIDASYGLSKSIPTPFQNDHIRFGVAIVIAVSFSIQLLKQSARPKWLWILSIVFLTIYLHVLASKTALLSLYIIIFYEVLILIVKRKRWQLGLGILSTLVALPIIFFYASSSFNKKFWYSMYSISEMGNEKVQTNISDEGRIVSYQTAVNIYKEYWVLGVGVGDGQDAMAMAYDRQDIQSEKILYPHNQFIYIALVTGSIGLLYFLYCVFFFFKKHFRTSEWLGSFLLLFIIPFTVEAFLNTQYGIALFLFFFLLLQRKEVSN